MTKALSKNFLNNEMPLKVTLLTYCSFISWVNTLIQNNVTPKGVKHFFLATTNDLN